MSNSSRSFRASWPTWITKSKDFFNIKIKDPKKLMNSRTWWKIEKLWGTSIWTRYWLSSKPEIWRLRTFKSRQSLERLSTWMQYMLRITTMSKNSKRNSIMKERWNCKLMIDWKVWEWKWGRLKAKTSNLTFGRISAESFSICAKIYSKRMKISSLLLAMPIKPTSWTWTSMRQVVESLMVIKPSILVC